MIETVVVLMFFVNDKLMEHRIQDSISDCLKHKRLLTRNMSMQNKSIQCIETEAEIEINVDGSKTIKKLIMKKMRYLIIFLMLSDRLHRSNRLLSKTREVWTEGLF
jgi:hypothetical protein